jgi:hypothetical protein
MWTARRILKELTDGDLRRKVLAAFWRHGDQQARATATVQLARAMKFRDESIRKMTPEKKADLLATRIGAADFDQYLEMALMQYHTHHASEMMAAFLDAWQVPHDKGSIEVDDYTPPTADQVREAVKSVGASYDRGEVALYLASAGLLMDGPWREGTWPVVDELAGGA